MRDEEEDGKGTYLSLPLLTSLSRYSTIKVVPEVIKALHLLFPISISAKHRRRLFLAKPSFASEHRPEQRNELVRIELLRFASIGRVKVGLHSLGNPRNGDRQSGCSRLVRTPSSFVEWSPEISDFFVGVMFEDCLSICIWELDSTRGGERTRERTGYFYLRMCRFLSSRCKRRRAS